MRFWREARWLCVAASGIDLDLRAATPYRIPHSPNIEDGDNQDCKKIIYLNLFIREKTSDWGPTRIFRGYPGKLYG